MRPAAQHAPRLAHENANKKGQHCDGAVFNDDDIVVVCMSVKPVVVALLLL